MGSTTEGKTMGSSTHYLKGNEKCLLLFKPFLRVHNFLSLLLEKAAFSKPSFFMCFFKKDFNILDRRNMGVFPPNPFSQQSRFFSIM